MRGIVEVNRVTGSIDHQLEAENLQRTQELSKEQLEQLRDSLIFIMQDINLYTKRNGGEQTVGQVQQVNLKLDDHHAVSLVCTPEIIRANFEPIATLKASAD